MNTESNFYKKSVFDFEGMMERLMDDIDLARIITKVFISDTAKQICTLKQEIINHDCKNVEIQAHSMKGAAGNIGAEKFCCIAGKMEVAGRNSDLATVSNLMPELEKQFQMAIDEIKYKMDSISTRGRGH
jgi:HPt (histidine-containing phosphotransfer) domain-containing protein